MNLLDISSCNPAGAPLRRSVSARRLSASLFRILKDTSLCSLATVDSAQSAHINIAYFCYTSDLAFYFLSHPRSRHCRNLSTNPSMAVAVFSSRQMWGKQDRGVQLFGYGSMVTPPQIEEAARLYAERFPSYSAWQADLPESDGGREYRFYSFVPSSLTLLDELSFGDGVIVSARFAR